jgi:hypothetical protein
MTPKPTSGAVYVRVSTSNERNQAVFEQNPEVQEQPLRPNSRAALLVRSEGLLRSHERR